MAYPVNFPTGQPNKVHHSYIWLSSLIGVLTVGVIGILSSLDSIVPLVMEFGTGRVNVLLVLGIAILSFLLLYGVIVGVSVLAYRNLRYVFDEKEFSLYSGIITKRRVHVPYARVQSVNHKQSLVQRIAGVCTVEIDTAGGASNKAVKVPYVLLSTGEAIRHDLFVRKAASLAGAENQVQVLSPGQTPIAGQVPLPGQVPAAAPAGVPVAAGMPVPTQANGNILDGAVGDFSDDFRGIYDAGIAGMEPVSFERRLDNKELLLASVSHSGIVGVAATFIVLFVAAIIPFMHYAPEWGAFGLLLLPMFIIGFVFFVGLSIATVALSFGKFAVRRRGSRIEVERGILQRDFSGIDIDRIQSVVIKQSLVRRLLGYCEVSLGRINAGGGEDQNTQAKLNAGGLIVHPFLKVDQVEGLLANLLPEYADRPQSAEFKSLAPVALRRGLIRRCIWRNGALWTALFIGAFQIVLNVVFANETDAAYLSFVNAGNACCVAAYMLCALSTVATAVGTLWWARGSGFATNARYLALCNDGLHTETIYIPRQKVQDVLTRTNPFQRMAHTTTIGALCAAGVGGTYSILWDVTEEDGNAWLEWLQPRIQQQASLANN